MKPQTSDTEIFMAVMEAGSFAAAARALHMTNSTVSRMVVGLENRLGVELLHRNTRRLAPTEAGALYFERWRLIRQSVADAEHEVSALGSSVRGSLRVAIATALGARVLAPLLPGFNARHPDLRIELVLGSDPLDLIEHHLDMALRLGAAPLDDSELSARPLGHLEVGLFASSGYVRTYGSPEHPSQLADHRTLALQAHRRREGFAWTLSHGAEQVRAAITPWLVTTDPLPLLQTMCCDGGIVMASPEVMQPEIAAGGVLPVMPTWRGPRLALHALYPRERMRTPKLREFIDYLIEARPSGTLE